MSNLNDALEQMEKAVDNIELKNPRGFRNFASTVRSGTIPANRFALAVGKLIFDNLGSKNGADVIAEVFDGLNFSRPKTELTCMITRRCLGDLEGVAKTAAGQIGAETYQEVMGLLGRESEKEKNKKPPPPSGVTNPSAKPLNSRPIWPSKPPRP